MNSFAGIVLLGIVLAVLTIGMVWKKGNILELLLFGIVYWFCAWIVVGMGLFVLDAFRLFRCACITDAFVLLSGAAAGLLRRKQGSLVPQVSWDVREYWIPLLICICGFGLVAVKHEFFGMGQDEGVYQTVAINFMNGMTDRQQDFSEYHQLPPEQQQLFETHVHNHLVGYDIGSDDYPDTVYDRDVSPVSGIYHGIPTFASLLALWGTIFGMSQMQGIQTLFYFCVIFLVYCICRNLKLRQCSSALACAVTAASPVVIWVAKSALTEMFLGVLIALFLYFLTDAAHPERQWMSILPIVVFGCFHVSIFTLVPLFLVIYGGMFWVTRRKCFAVLMPVTVVTYLCSFFAMRHVQPFYTMNNYRVIFFQGITQKDLPWLIPAVCGLALVICGLFIWAVHRFVHRRYADCSVPQYLERVCASRTGFVLVELLLVSLVLVILLKCILSEDPLTALASSSLWGYVCCCGIIFLIAVWIAAVARPRYYLETPGRLVLLVSAFYCILFYSAFLRPEVEYFYYYGRYLVPYLSVAAIFGALTLDQFQAKATVPVMAASLLVVSPYDLFLARTKDDTRMEWNVLEDVASAIEPDSCVIVDGASSWTLQLPLRAMRGAAVYPQMGTVMEQASQLQEQYDTVYYIGSASADPAFSSTFQLVYRNQAEISEDTSIGGKYFPTPFPLEYAQGRQTVTVYQYGTEQLEYDASSCSSQSYLGFYNLEGHFCWSAYEEAAIQCCLEEKDYIMTLELGQALPLKNIGVTEYPVTVLVDGEEVGQLLIDEAHNGNGCTLSLEIPAHTLKNGYQTVTLACDLWPASVVTESDVRMLGIPVKSLRFTPTDPASASIGKE